MKIEKNMKICVDITTKELADLFCNMMGDDQADFFSEIAENVKGWDAAFCMQTEDISDSYKLTKEGREIMKTIGEYSFHNFKG